jgi:CHASE2 domain-containing sensor protein
VPKVFISYRRDDASANAGRLCDWLQRQFKADNVFLDVDKLAPGEDFPKALQESLAAADVLVAVVGKAWVTLCDAAGTRRIMDPKDFVALEVGTALERGIRVIPVLVGGAAMPKAGELPPRLAKFVDCNAISIDDARFRQDFDNLVDGIVGRARGFARRELDRLQRGMRVLKAGSLLAPAIALVLLFTAWMQVFDFFLLDTRVASYSMWLGERFAGAPRDPPVVLVAIDEDSEKRLRKYERTPEWRRDHAKLIDRLVDLGARTIVFDLYFESTIGNETAADSALAEAIARANAKGTRVIVGIRALVEGKPKVLPVLTSATAAGSSAASSSDSFTGSLCIGTRLGYAFNVPLAVSAEDKGKRELPAKNPALGLAAVFPGAVEAIDEERHEIRIRDRNDNRFALYSVLDFEDGGSDCPTLGAGTAVATLLLRLSPSGYWREPPRRIAYADVLAPPSAAQPLKLDGKIALVGVTLREDQHDVVRGWASEKIYGAELHADTIANLSRGVAVRPLGPTAQWLLMLVLAAAGAALSFVLFDRPAGQRRVALGVLLLAYAAVAVACYLAFDILFNTLYDVAASAVAYAWLSRLQRKALEPLAEGSP